MTNKTRDYSEKIAYWSAQHKRATITGDIKKLAKAINKLDYFKGRQMDLKPKPQIYVNNMLTGETSLVATFTGKGDALICLNALTESNCQSNMRYTLDSKCWS
jgi:hypothetical protein